MPDVYVPCEVCKGKRYNAQTLEIKYKGKTISDILEMRVDEANEFFAAIPRIHNKLSTICDVGLGYIKMGQPATTLSGGEAQRVKLATELSRRSTGRTFYVLDEPTTGLHFADIHKLLEVLDRLVKLGNTVLVIEHNLDVIKTADYLIDLGPEGGDRGGTVVATGTPEEVAQQRALAYRHLSRAGAAGPARGGAPSSRRCRARTARARESLRAARSRRNRPSSDRGVNEARRPRAIASRADRRGELSLLRTRRPGDHRRRVRRAAARARRARRGASRAARTGLADAARRRRGIGALRTLRARAADAQLGQRRDVRRAARVRRSRA